MKNKIALPTLLLIAFAVYWSFNSAMPSYSENTNTPLEEFSTDRALEHVKNIAQKPHAVGFAEHAVVRNYISSELEKIGLEVSLQEGYTAGDWGNLSKATNIIAKKKGTKPGKALVLLSHYDSQPHSSFGASDAGSGIATILEGIRHFIKNNTAHKNDIIILFTDAEELGLNGADLFVSKHPWAKDVGLVLNFEARGSGGPSYMLIETNKGNSNLIKEFTKANPDYPVANSLVYSIYKMLPNDTDLTVFREKGDIEGFNFAFIDDHYDYHTARDTYANLDRKTLAHQGSYLIPLLNYFSNSDLDHLKSEEDFVYFNIPFFKLVSYPFKWIIPMLLLAIVLFFVLLIKGLKNKYLAPKEIITGFIPMLIALIINGIVGYYSWTVLKIINPHYKDILHGFTYNGHTYIAVFVLFSIAVCFWVYAKFKKISAVNSLVAPIVLWLLICSVVAFYLKGASFFILPVYALLASFYVLQTQKSPFILLLVFLSLPALWLYAPFIKMFPIGLGLKMMVASTLLTTLTFILLLPVFAFYKSKKKISLLFFIFSLGFLIVAHLNSGFNTENQKPTSLLYMLNADTQTAEWATYENELSTWTKQYINNSKLVDKKQKTISSKYGTNFTSVSDAPLKDIKAPLIETTYDTIIGNLRHLSICISPQRKINRLEVFTNEIELKDAKVNNVALSNSFLEKRTNNKLITHYITDNAYTEIALSFNKNLPIELTIMEASNDLLDHKLFSVPKRPLDNIPMPFVLNDAVVVTKTIKY